MRRTSVLVSRLASLHGGRIGLRLGRASISLLMLLAVLLIAAGGAQAASAPTGLVLKTAVGRSAPLASALVRPDPLRSGITPRVAAHGYDRFVVATGVAAEELPDATIIVRGGESELPPAGEVFSGSQGQTLDEAAAGVRHGTIRSTTAGDIRAGGGTVRPNPEFDARVGRVNHQHVDVCLGAGSCPFSDPFENPVPKSRRFGFPNYPYDRWGP
jgi:hypothetical protein